MSTRRRLRGLLVALAAVLAAVIAVALVGVVAPAAEGDTTDPVLVGAGDIAACGLTPGAAGTGALIQNLPDATVFTLGDNVYDKGTDIQFAACYDPWWGSFKARTHPAAGNHDYNTPGATGYYAYFGAAAGDPTLGYYSYDLGAWHVVVLNSNCLVVSCAAGSPQDQWLRADIAAHPADCTLAYWHHPRFSSGHHGNSVSVQPFWDALYEAGADLVLNGHDHTYEVFDPQDPTGTADPAGIREIVVGTGGASHYAFEVIKPNSAVRNGDTFGVIQLTLHATGYDWQFLPVPGGTFTDAGSGTCLSGTRVAPTTSAAPGTTPATTTAASTGATSTTATTTAATTTATSSSPTTTSATTTTATSTPPSSTPPPPPPQPNLLTNPGFETDANSDGRPDGWTSNTRFTRSTAIAAHEGGYVGRHKASDPSTTSYAVSSVVRSLTAGTRYDVSSWINVPTTSDTFTFTLDISWRTASNSVISRSTLRSVSRTTQGAWQQATSTLTAPARTTNAQLRMVVKGLAATIYVDDFSLRTH